MSKVVACVVARTVSTRLPLKVLRDLDDGVNMLEYLICRLKKVRMIDDVYICTSIEQQDDILEDVALRTNTKIYRGSADQVTERIIAVGNKENADVVIRITGDNPFTSVEYIDEQIKFLLDKKLDYVRLVDVPIGATAEVIDFNALVDCHNNMDPNISEYLMLFLFNPQRYKCGIIKVFDEDFSKYSVTVDTPNDLLRSKEIIRLSENDIYNISLKEIIGIYQKNSKLPDMLFKSGTSVKMPYDKIIPFKEFEEDMQNRKNNSVKLKLYE